MIRLAEAAHGFNASIRLSVAISVNSQGRGAHGRRTKFSLTTPRLGIPMANIFALLLPAVVPSWRFFDRVTASPRIEVGVFQSGSPDSLTWKDFRPRPARVGLCTMLVRMFWNPHWNESLYLVSLAERIVATGCEHAVRGVWERVEGSRFPEGRGVCFRVVMVSREGDDLVQQVAFQSAATVHGS